MDNLVKAVCANFPTDRKVKPTVDRHLWYRIMGDSLMVPPERILKANVMEIDKFIESVMSFSVSDLQASEYDWENLNLFKFGGTGVYLGFELLLKILQGGIKCGVDIETRRLEWEDNRLLAIGFAVDESTCYAFYDIPEDAYGLLQKALQFDNVTYVWHNGKFDCGRLKYLCNIEGRVDEDTMLKHYARVSSRRGTHGLKDLGQLYLQAPEWEKELDTIKRDWCKKNKKNLKDFMYDDIPTNVLVPYMQRDCIATLRLDNKLDRLAKPSTEFIYSVLIKASNVYKKIELNGMQLDIDYLEDLEYILENQEKEYSNKFNEIVSHVWDPMRYVKETGSKSIPSEFNLKSPKQLKWLLSSVVGYPLPSTDAATMQILLEDCASGKVKNPEAKELIESLGMLRKTVKYMDTYVQGLRNVVCGDGRIRGTFNLHGTETGRLSSNNPNMQNIPRNSLIKNLLVSAPGKILMQFDYSQAELRVLAYLSEDEWLQRVYTEGRDLHDAVSIEMFGEGFTKEQRNEAKTINFGIAYGRGPASLAQQFGKSTSEARQIIDKWFRPMPKVKAFIDNRRQMPMRNEPCVTPFGRERNFIITNEDLNHIQNEYINTPIQSVASDLTLLSVLEIDGLLEDMQMDAKIVSTVHDSVILEVVDDADVMEKVSEMCKEVMARVPSRYLPNCNVPFRADVEVGYKWGELTKYGE